MLIESFNAFLVILGIEFPKVKIKIHIVAGYRYTHAPPVRVEYLVAFIGVVVEQPLVKGYGLLGGVDAVIALWPLIKCFCASIK